MAFTPATNLEAVEALYIGYFGRAGEPGGVQYWLTQMNNGATFAQVAAQFSVQQEAKNEYAFLAAPDLASPVEFITALYNNLLERAPDAAGLAYWVGQAEAAEGNPFAIGLLVAQFISGATNSAEGQDIDTLQNKIDAAEFFTDALADANISGTDGAGQVLPTVQEAGKNIIGAVTSDDATVTTANEASSDFAAGGASGDGVAITIAAGNSVAINSADPAFRSTESADTVSGTLEEGQSVATAGGNDNVNVTVALSAAVGDRATILGGSGNDTFTVVVPDTALVNLDGGANTDSLTLTLAASGIGGTSAIQNIENIEVSATTDTTIDGALIDGLQTLTFQGNAGTDYDIIVTDLADGVVLSVVDVDANGDSSVTFADEQATATVTIDNVAGGFEVNNVADLTYNIVSNSTAEIFATNAQSFSLTGSGELLATIDLNFVGADETVTFDASALTAQTSLTFTNIAADSEITLTGLRDVSTFSLTSQFSTEITTGAGNDTSNFTTLTNLSLDGGDIDTFATIDYNAGDIIDVGGVNGGTFAAFGGNLIGQADLDSALDVVAAATAANNYTTFEFQGSTYVYYEDATAGVSNGDGLLQINAVGLSATALVTA